MEISIHSILHIRQVYPQHTFERRQKYGAIVYKSRVPIVQSYISSLVDSIIDQVKFNKVNNMILVIINKYNEPLEKFIFHFDNKFISNEHSTSDQSNWEDELSVFIYNTHINT